MCHKHISSVWDRAGRVQSHTKLTRSPRRHVFPDNYSPFFIKRGENYMTISTEFIDSLTRLVVAITALVAILAKF